MATHLTRRRTARRPVRILLGLLLGLVVALYGFVWLILPGIVRREGEERLTALLHRPVKIAAVSINPLQLAAAVRGLEIREPDGQNVFVAWEELAVDFELSSLWRGEWHFARIALVRPTVRVEARADGSLNFSDLIPATEPTAATATAPARPVRVDHLTLTEARAEFRDLAPAKSFTTTLGPISFAATDFATAGDDHAPYTFEAVTESGEKLSWQGTIRAAPFRSRGELVLAGLVLPKYSTYHAGGHGIEVLDGNLTVRGRYDVSLEEGHRVLKLLDGSVGIRSLRLADRASGEVVLDLPKADLIGAAADGLARTASVREVVLADGRVVVRRERGGELNWVRLLRPPAGAPPAAGAPVTPAPTAPAAAATPGVALGKFAVQNLLVEVEDLVPDLPLKLQVKPVDLSVKDVTLAPGARMPLEVSAALSTGGRLAVKGAASLQPIAADLELTVDALALSPLNSYVEEAANARIGQGLLSVGGRVIARVPDQGAPDWEFGGQVWLENFEVVETPSGRSLVACGDLVLAGLQAKAGPPPEATIAEIHVAQPRVRVVRNRDGGINLAALMKAPPAGPPPSAAPIVSPVTAPAPKWSVGRVVVHEGDFGFNDDGIQPDAQVGLSHLSGSVTTLASAAVVPGAIELEARLNQSAPLVIRGQSDGAGGGKVSVEFRNLDLRGFSPYSGKYAGYEVGGGRAALDVGAQLTGRQLRMANVVTIDAFNFGRPVKSPDATSLPVRLAVSLLKDTNDRIIIDVPVQGNLDDPEFRIGRVVLRVIVNLLTKAATAPFSMLGALVGGGSEDLSTQAFAPGDSALSGEGLGRLDKLAKALNNRPALNVTISGSHDGESDAAALRQQKLSEMVEASARQERLKAAPDQTLPARLQLTPEEFAHTVKAIFDRRFPPGSDLGTPLPTPPIVMPLPERERTNWVRRVYYWATFRDRRDRAAFQREQMKAHEEFLAAAKRAVDTGMPLEVMTERLASTIEVVPAELQALADARAATVRDYLVNVGRIGPERIEVAAPPGPDSAPKVALPGRPEVKLELR